MATGVDHLLRRNGVYWWRRRIPRAIAPDLNQRIARSLHTTDPVEARRRARACSTAFDIAVVRATTEAPDRRLGTLLSSIDDVFARILRDGEPEDGPPDADENSHRHGGVHREGVTAGNHIGHFATLDAWVSEWWNADLRKRLKDPDLPVDRTMWLRVVANVFLIAFEAYANGESRDRTDLPSGRTDVLSCTANQHPVLALNGIGWPPLGPAQGAAECEAARARQTSAAAAPMLFSASFTAFMASKSVWTKKTRVQAEAVLTRFLSLMGDRTVLETTRSVAEAFKERLRKVPALNGKSIYAAKTLGESIELADRIASGLSARQFPLQLGTLNLDEKRAHQLVQRLSLKTINRDFTFLTNWGRWMERSDDRRPLLDRDRSPFTGLLNNKADVEKESRRSGRKRVGFSHAGIALLLDSLPPAGRSGDEVSQRQQARRRAVLISLYSGMRLGEIAQLRARDFKREGGIDFVDLSEDGERELKSEAGARRIPMHPMLVRAGLLETVASLRNGGEDFILARPVMHNGKDAVSSSISKWFLRWRRDLGIEEASKPFHALRHTFAHALRASSRGRDALVDQILGHEPGGVGARVYTDDLPLAEKATLIASVRYSDLADPGMSSVED